MQVNVRDTGPIPGSKRSLGGGHGNPLQYSCLENAMDRGAWRVTVHRVAKIWTGLKEFSTHAQLIYNVVFVSSVQQSDSVAQSCPTLTSPWTEACQAPLSMRFSRQEYWSGLPFPSPGHPPNPGMEPCSPALQVDSLPTELPGKP